MDKYFENNGNGYILTEFTEVGHIGNEYPCPQPHPFKDGEDCAGKYRIEIREGWPGFSQLIAVPIDNRFMHDLFDKMKERVNKSNTDALNQSTEAKIAVIGVGDAIDHDEQNCPCCKRDREREAKEQVDDWVRVEKILYEFMEYWKNSKHQTISDAITGFVKKVKRRNNNH